jgi:hypothetical protein
MPGVVSTKLAHELASSPDEMPILARLREPAAVGIDGLTVLDRPASVRRY